MANTVEHHAKLIIGDLVLTVAKLSAEKDALAERLARAEAQVPGTPPPPTPPGS
jgi:hypothetical protein